MSVPEEFALTNEEIRRLKDLSKRTGDKTISAVECDKIRTQFREGQHVVPLGEEFGVDRHVIRSHATGRCTCNTSVAPIPRRQTERRDRLLCDVEGCEFESALYDPLADHFRDEHGAGELQ